MPMLKTQALKMFFIPVLFIGLLPAAISKDAPEDTEGPFGISFDMTTPEKVMFRRKRFPSGNMRKEADSERAPEEQAAFQSSTSKTHSSFKDSWNSSPKEDPSPNETKGIPKSFVPNEFTPYRENKIGLTRRLRVRTIPESAPASTAAISKDAPEVSEGPFGISFDMTTPEKAMFRRKRFPKMRKEAEQNEDLNKMTKEADSERAPEEQAAFQSSTSKTHSSFKDSWNKSSKEDPSPNETKRIPKSFIPNNFTTYRESKIGLTRRLHVRTIPESAPASTGWQKHVLQATREEETFTRRFCLKTVPDPAPAGTENERLVQTVPYLDDFCDLIISVFSTMASISKKAVATLPENMRPSPDLYGFLWEKVIWSAVLVLLCQIYLSVRNRLYFAREKKPGSSIAELIKEKNQLHEKLSRQQNEEFQSALKDSILQNLKELITLLNLKLAELQEDMDFFKNEAQFVELQLLQKLEEWQEQINNLRKQVKILVSSKVDLN